MKPSIQQRLKSIALALITLTAAVFAQAETKLYYIHNDHLGTPVAMTDENQVVVWEAKRKPFGETTETTNTVDQQARFPGQYQDEETGLSNNYHRDYDPSVARYIQSDPIGINYDYSDPRLQVAFRQGIPISSGANGIGLNHLYQYVSQNPMGLIDPYGLNQMNRSPYAPGGNRSRFDSCQLQVTIASAFVTGGAVGLILRGSGLAATALTTTSGPIFALVNALCPLDEKDNDEKCE